MGKNRAYCTVHAVCTVLYTCTRYMNCAHRYTVNVVIRQARVLIWYCVLHVPYSTVLECNHVDVQIVLLYRYDFRDATNIAVFSA